MKIHLPPLRKLAFPVALATLAFWLLLQTAFAGEAAADQASQNPFPAEVDLRPAFAGWKLPVKKQGARNTCSVMTVASGMEYALCKRFNQRLLVSAEYLNWACNQVIHNRTQDRGQFFRDLLTGYERHGICTETEMPYARKFLPNYQPTEQATNHAQVVRSYGLRAHWIKPNDGAKGITDLHLQQMKDVLRKGWPVCAGSYHSVLVVGYKDDAAVPGGGGFYLRDSGSGQQEIMSYQEAKARLCDLLWFEAEPGASK